MKDKVNELATHCKNKNIRDYCRGIREFKKGYQHRSNLVKNKNYDMAADFHNMLNKWKNCFSQLLHAPSVSDVRHMKIHTAEPVAT